MRQQQTADVWVLTDGHVSHIYWKSVTPPPGSTGGQLSISTDTETESASVADQNRRKCHRYPQVKASAVTLPLGNRSKPVHPHPPANSRLSSCLKQMLSSAVYAACFTAGRPELLRITDLMSFRTFSSPALSWPAFVPQHGTLTALQTCRCTSPLLTSDLMLSWRSPRSPMSAAASLAALHTALIALQACSWTQGWARWLCGAAWSSFKTDRSAALR